MKLGVCWYPEQWPEALWASDVQRMAARPNIAAYLATEARCKQVNGNGKQ